MSALAAGRHRVSPWDRVAEVVPGVVVGLRERRPQLLALVVVAAVGAAVAEASVPALVDLASVPPLPVALVWPAFTASLVAAAVEPVQPVLRATAARHLVLADGGWLTGLLVFAVVATVPGAVLSGSPVGVLRNLLGLCGVAVLVRCVTGSRAAATLAPWVYVTAAAVLGLDSSQLGQPRWRWWAWLVDADASPWWACGLAALAYGAVAVRAVWGWRTKT
jgi:hypothetical protein